MNFARKAARAMLKERTWSAVLWDVVSVVVERQRPTKTFDGGERRMEVRAWWGVWVRRWWIWRSDVSFWGGHGSLV